MPVCENCHRYKGLINIDSPIFLEKIENRHSVVKHRAEDVVKLAVIELHFTEAHLHVVLHGTDDFQQRELLPKHLDDLFVGRLEFDFAFVLAIDIAAHLY